MPIILKKNEEGIEPRKSSDDVVVLSSMDKRIERKLVTPQRIAIAVGAVLLVAVTIYAYVHYGLTRTLTVGSERLTVSKVSYGTFREYIPVTGNVVPRTTIYLDAISGGQVTEVHTEEGAMVKAGEPIVTFKNTDLQLRVITTEAQAFGHEDVKLLDGPFLKAQEVGKAQLLKYDPDRLIAPCYEAIGLKPKKPRYGGWEAQGVSGHILGHWLSATARMAAATGDAELKTRLDYAVSELAMLQSKRSRASDSGRVG